MKYLLPFAVLPFSLLLTSTALADSGVCDHTTTPDGPTNFNVFYDAFSVVDGGSDTCSWTQATVLPSDTFGVYSADYMGGTGPDGSATLTTFHNGKTTTTALALDDEYTVTQYLGTESGVLNDDITLAAGPDGFVGLDTVDYVLRGTTTLDSVEASLDEVATGRTAIVTHLGATADLLDGEVSADPDNSLTLIGAAGSYTVGVNGHVNLMDGFSLDAGGALVGQDVGGAAVNGLLVSAMGRYLSPDDGGVRWFAGLGGYAAPGMSMDFTRHYDDGSEGGATVTGSTKGTLLTASAEAGLLYADNAGNITSIKGEVSHSWLALDGYSETFGLDNLFPLSTDDSTSGFDTIKLEGSWTTALSNSLNLTLTGGIGSTIAENDVDADIEFVGPVGVSGQSELFADYEARLGWAVATGTNLDVFARGSTGSVTGTHLQAGTSLTLKF